MQNTDQTPIYQYVRSLDGQTLVTYATDAGLPPGWDSSEWTSHGAQFQLWSQAGDGRVGVKIVRSESDLTTRLVATSDPADPDLVGFASKHHPRGTSTPIAEYPQLLDCPRRFEVGSSLPGVGSQEVWVQDPEDLRHMGLTPQELAEAQELPCDYLIPRMLCTRLFVRPDSNEVVCVSNDVALPGDGDLNCYSGDRVVMRVDLPQANLSFRTENPIEFQEGPSEIQGVYRILPESSERRLWVEWNFPGRTTDEVYSYWIHFHNGDEPFNFDPKIINRAEQIPPSGQTIGN